VQAISSVECNSLYGGDMPIGRPATTKRTPFGTQLYEFRTKRGLSQKDLAEALSITQQGYAVWERRPVALRPDQLTALSKLLECSIDELLGLNYKAPKQDGPIGRVRQAFEQVSKLPRGQQRKIIEVVEALCSAQS
jgi:transcriptional regulator with XRE-family HTH domain